MPDNKKPLRRSSLITPYGVGAIIPFPSDEAFMVAGLDEWKYRDKNEFIINDARLENWLGVRELRWPPDFRDRTSGSSNVSLTIPMVRFPTWYYCPFCGQVSHVKYFSPRPSCDAKKFQTGRICTKAGKKMIPDRFMAVCPQGHIDDFPILEWVHHGKVDSSEKHEIVRRSTGSASSSLAGVVYTCSCGAKRSMVGAFAKGALESIGYKCKGTMPWLGITEDHEHPCFEEPSSAIGVEGFDDTVVATQNSSRVLLRGATNAWFASVASSIYIPSQESEEEKKLNKTADEFISFIANGQTGVEFESTLITLMAAKGNVSVDALKAVIEKKKQADHQNETHNASTEDEYRTVEYHALIQTSGSEEDEFCSVSKTIKSYDESIWPYFKSICLVKKLRETRVFTGFSRLKPDSVAPLKRRKMLRLNSEDWLPAIESFGEGIFFEFDDALVNQWVSNYGVQERISKLNGAYINSYLANREPNVEDYHLKPEYVMIHTFSHLIINQLSYDCGYGSSALRERMYCERMNYSSKMHGVLIYTASGDSEGSMGGLVRQGEPGRLEDTIIKAITNAQWCSSDPVCIQSNGQGPESMNLAACHSCALLPETCCENGNRLLDRGVVVGTLDNKSIGFFEGLLKEK